MYGIFTYIYHTNQPNVGRYTIHGCYGRGYTQKSSHQIQECLLQVHWLLGPCSWEPGAIWNGRLHQLRCRWFSYVPTYYHRNQPNVGKIIIYGWYRNCLRHFQRNHPRWGFLLKILSIQLRSTNHHRKGSFFVVGSPPPAFTQLPGSFSFTRKKWRSGSTAVWWLDGWIGVDPWVRPAWNRGVFEW